MPRRAAWSIAMTRPPAVGVVASELDEPVVCGLAAPRAATRPRATGRCAAAGSTARVVSSSSKVADDDLAVGRRPLHVAVDPGEVHRPHDAAVGQRLAVAVLVVGPGLVEVVVDERDGAGVGAERRARQRQASTARRRTPRATADAPRPVVARVVDLVEHHERVPRPAWPRRGRRRGHLLVGRDDAVHVGGQRAVAGATSPGRGGARTATRPAPTAASGAGSAPRRPAPPARVRRPGPAPAAVRAKVVLPAPGVATARKSVRIAELEAVEGLASARHGGGFWWDAYIRRGLLLVRSGGLARESRVSRGSVA